MIWIYLDIDFFCISLVKLLHQSLHNTSTKYCDLLTSQIAQNLDTFWIALLYKYRISFYGIVHKIYLLFPGRRITHTRDGHIKTTRHYGWYDPRKSERSEYNIDPEYLTVVLLSSA